jgi:lipopolysaccharide transport system permease protein
MDRLARSARKTELGLGHASALASESAEASLLSSSPAGSALTVIKPTSGWAAFRLHDLWEYRELLYFLVWRDVKVRYKQTTIGVLWAVIQPLALMLLLTLVFGRLVRVPTEGVPYPLFAYVALLPWQLFAYSMSQAGTSLVSDQHLISKVYFPRLVIPISAAFAGLVDFGIASIVLVALMVYFGVALTVAALLLPALLLLAVLAAVAVGLWLSALNVMYRDVQYTLPFLTQLWLFATPIAYPASLVPDEWRLVYGLNPMVGVVESLRWALFRASDFPGDLLAMSIGVVVVLVVSGLAYFRRVERSFADVI